MEAYKGVMQGGMNENYRDLIVLIIIAFFLTFSAWLVFPRKGAAV